MGRIDAILQAPRCDCELETRRIEGAVEDESGVENIGSEASCIASSRCVKQNASVRWQGYSAHLVLNSNLPSMREIL